MASSALERLQHVKNALTSTGESHGNQIVPSALNPFRCRVPSHLPPYHTPLTPVSFLLRAAQIYPDSVALDHPERGYSFTYSQWTWRIANLAHGLLARGVKQGDKVGVISPNSPMILEALQALPGRLLLVLFLEKLKALPSHWSCYRPYQHPPDQVRNCLHP